MVEDLGLERINRSRWNNVGAVLYQEEGRWWATHYGCSFEKIGPFETEKEARKAQAIEDSPPHLGYYSRSETQKDRDYALLLSLGGKSWNGYRFCQGSYYGCYLAMGSYHWVRLEQVEGRNEA